MEFFFTAMETLTQNEHTKISSYSYTFDEPVENEVSLEKSHSIYKKWISKKYKHKPGGKTWWKFCHWGKKLKTKVEDEKTSHACVLSELILWRWLCLWKWSIGFNKISIKGPMLFLTESRNERERESNLMFNCQHWRGGGAGKAQVLLELNVLADVCNPSIQKTDVEGLLLRPAGTTEWDPVLVFVCLFVLRSPYTVWKNLQ